MAAAIFHVIGLTNPLKPPSPFCWQPLFACANLLAMLMNPSRKLAAQRARTRRKRARRRNEPALLSGVTPARRGTLHHACVDR
jgi:hypothetical protein